MNYEGWRELIFGQAEDLAPTDVEFSDGSVDAVTTTNFDYIDQALADPEIHQRYSPEQIGIGLQLIYSNCCSNLCFCYVQAGDDDRRVQGIRQMKLLYRNYFDRYCTQPVNNVGNDFEGWLGYNCYMLWDFFVLYPGNASPAMTAAGLEVMADALTRTNDNSLVSALHGLGHWSLEVPEATTIIMQWQRRPTTTNPEVLQYAAQAATGCIQ